MAVTSMDRPDAARSLLGIRDNSVLMYASFRSIMPHEIGLCIRTTISDDFDPNFAKTLLLEPLVLTEPRVTTLRTAAKSASKLAMLNNYEAQDFCIWAAEVCINVFDYLSKALTETFDLGCYYSIHVKLAMSNIVLFRSNSEGCQQALQAIVGQEVFF